MLLHQNQQLSAVLNSIQQPESLGFNALKPLHAFEASLPQRPAQRPRRPGIESHPTTLFFLTLSDSSDLSPAPAPLPQRRREPSRAPPAKPGVAATPARLGSREHALCRLWAPAAAESASACGRPRSARPPPPAAAEASGLGPGRRRRRPTSRVRPPNRHPSRRALGPAPRSPAPPTPPPSSSLARVACSRRPPRPPSPAPAATARSVPEGAEAEAAERDPPCR